MVGVGQSAVTDYVCPFEVQARQDMGRRQRKEATHQLVIIRHIVHTCMSCFVFSLLLLLHYVRAQYNCFAMFFGLQRSAQILPDKDVVGCKADVRLARGRATSMYYLVAMEATVWVKNGDLFWVMVGPGRLLIEVD